MNILIVVNDPAEWPFNIPGVEVVAARQYLTRSEYSDLRSAKVYNLCRSFRYQTTGYYVSLLAEARGHKPCPSVGTIQDIKSQTMIRFVSEELEELIQKSLERIHSEKFTLSVYFGRNLAQRYERLSMHLFNMFEAPLLRAQFVRTPLLAEGREARSVRRADASCLAPQPPPLAGRWSLRSVSAIPASEIPDAHREFVMQTAAQHFAGRRSRVQRKSAMRYDLAILHNPEDAEPPSNAKALEKFIKAAESLAIDAELITRDDFGRLAEFDALFIRETTFLNHHTYRFSRRADSEGLVVIDDPVSILRCTNKVYLTELMWRHKIPTPKTMVVHKGNMDQVGSELGFPCVLKKPDSAFSHGVSKCENNDELIHKLEQLLDESDLVVAQEFVATTFDWRIGILEQRPFYACKYHMAPKHWQIINREDQGSGRYGRVETLPVELAPRRAVNLALKAANLIGDGLYGVDVKQSGNAYYVIEVNDNPTIDAGMEDSILRDELYRRIMSLFLARIERKKTGVAD